MTNKLLKSVLSIAAVMAASSFAMQAQAHCLTQSLAAGSTATQQDVYLINCPATTTSVYGRLGLISGATTTTYQLGAAANGGVTRTLNDTGATATMACKAANTDGVAYEHLDPTKGPTAYVSYAAVPGVNTLMVSKNSATASSYAIEFHCMTGAAGSATPQGSEVLGDYELSTVVDGLDSGTDTNVDANLVINH